MDAIVAGHSVGGISGQAPPPPPPEVLPSVGFFSGDPTGAAPVPLLGASADGAGWRPSVSGGPDPGSPAGSGGFSLLDRRFGFPRVGPRRGPT